MHLLEEKINFQGIQRFFMSMGCLGYKVQILKFVEAKNGLQYLEAKQLKVFCFKSWRLKVTLLQGFS